VDELPDQTSHKAFAAALVAVLLYVLHGLTTGEWASVNTIGPALTVLVLPLVVWWVPNKAKPVEPEDRFSQAPREGEVL
jgi:hypothetical protein